jgi:Actin-like ATPase involved in cell morphogenesis
MVLLPDFVVTEKMIKHFIKKVHKKNVFANPRNTCLCSNWDQPGLKKNLFQDSCLAARCKKVSFY